MPFWDKFYLILRIQAKMTIQDMPFLEKLPNNHWLKIKGDHTGRE